MLHNAALAALEVPANAPRPGQFVYTKLKQYQPLDGGTGVLESWLSADGVQAGLISGGTPATTGYSPGCSNGWYYYPNFRGHHQRCNPAENAAYFPDMPTSPGRCAPGCSGTSAVGLAMRAACSATSRR